MPKAIKGNTVSSFAWKIPNQLRNNVVIDQPVRKQRVDLLTRLSLCSPSATSFCSAYLSSSQIPKMITVIPISMEIVKGQNSVKSFIFQSVLLCLKYGELLT